MADESVLLGQLAEEYVGRVRQGQLPDLEEYAARHPELAERIRALFPTLLMLEGLAGAGPAAAAPGGGCQPGPGSMFGAYRILGEVGRGGMGVVYEAEHLLLNRRVALKVLPLQGPQPAHQLERFLREARTAAGLHHSNIVPVFDVGQVDGVPFYAMQLIEGRSLDRLGSPAVAANAGAVTQPSPDVSPTAAPAAGGVIRTTAERARWVADLGRQVAEALAYAHQRGVIHRDIKPSNLLLDERGVVWITDFGLARGTADVTLTGTGVPLGTPRYMSPEQAEAARRPVDHRTDIYSLGTTLYELLLGRPAFEGRTPQEVMTQILQREPVPPRRLDPAVPRDLETIIVKAMAKRPEERYPSAQALADDLRAFLERRAIRARRPRLAERAVRWVRKNRRSLLLATVSATAAALLVVGGLVAWSRYQQSKLGYVELTTKGPPLLAEVLDDNDDLVVPAFTVPTQQAVAVPAGSYHLRLSAPTDLSETVSLQVQRGHRQVHEVQLGGRRLWPQPLPLPAVLGNPPVFAVMNFGDRSDLVTVTPEQEGGFRMRRLDGATQKPVWEQTLDRNNQPASLGQAGWGALFAFTSRRGPELVQPAVDLDGDGVPDLIWAGRGFHAVGAFSGKDGRLLWACVGAPRLDQKVRLPDTHGASGVVGTPELFDLDGDGVPDVIATFQSQHQVWTTMKDGRKVVAEDIPPHAWVEAVSGRTGKPLWSRELGATEATLPAHVVRLAGKPRVVVLAGKSLRLLDGKTGRPVGPAYTPNQMPADWRFGDLNGDGQDDVLLAGGKLPNEVELTALSLARMRPLWQATVLNKRACDRYTRRAEGTEPLTVANLGGKPAVVLAQGTPEKDAGLVVLDGATGAVRWRWEEKPPPGYGPLQPPQQFVVGPDLDGDGYPEIFLAATGLVHTYREEKPGSSGAYTSASFLVVEALSGKDGHALWTWRRRQVGSGIPPIPGPLTWWQPGPDGWPELVVPFGAAAPTEPPPVFFILEGGTGRLAHLLSGLTEARAGDTRAVAARTADLDGDGIPDLYAFRRDGNTPGGKLFAFRGAPPVAWRQLRVLQVAQDFNGDGLKDLLNWNNPDGTVSAVSGRDGRTLWTSPLPGDRVASLPLPGGDLDGDGVPDLLVYRQSYTESGPFGEKYHPPLWALSGKDGHLLWEARDIHLPWQQNAIGAPLLTCRDLDGDGRPEVIFAYEQRTDNSADKVQFWLTVLSGRDGKLRWRQPLSDSGPYGGLLAGGSTSIGCSFADLDGDGVLDLVTWGISAAHQWELRAFSGRDGTPLWQHPVSLRGAALPPGQLPAPAVGRPEGGQGVSVFVTDFPGFGEWALLALDGKTGRQLWSYGSKLPNNAGFGALQFWPAPLLVDFQGNGRPTVCAVGAEDGQDTVLLLDGRGRPKARLPVSVATMQTQLLGAALGGGGRQTLLVLAGVETVAPRVLALDGTAHVLWSWSFAGNFGRLLTVTPGGAHRPATVVVLAGGREVYGLDGKTGKPRWRCGWPGEVESPTWYPPALLGAAEPGAAPRMVFYPTLFPDTACCQALPTAPDGRYLPPHGVPHAYEPASLRLPPAPVSHWWGGMAGLSRLLPIGAVVVLLVLALRRVRRRRGQEDSLNSSRRPLNPLS